MGGERDGIIGTDGETPEVDGAPPRGGFANPGPIGLKGGKVIVIDRKVSKVDDSDWTPPSPATSPEIVVNGASLADVAAALDTLEEWGRGGGSIRAVKIPPGNSPTVDVTLKANLVKVLPRWPEYSKASAGAKAAWDKMMAKLEIHEQRHVAIAIEEADQLVKDLAGKSIDDLVPMINAANRRMAARQKKMDGETDHGAKKGVTYGDVFLDTSIP